MLRPSKYEAPHKDLDIRPDEPGVPEGWGPWYVVVINDGAQTTKTPGGSQPHSELGFGEHFWVIEEDGLFLRIVRDPRPTDTRFSPEAEEMGWISKHDLLMWDVALEKPETGIGLKGFIVNAERSQQRQTDIDFTLVGAYKDPELTRPADYEARVFELLHIYQYSSERDAVLLGRRPYFNVGRLRTEGTYGGLVGWVDRSRILEWDHRVAIEPNFDARAVNERMQQNIRASVMSMSADQDKKWACAEDFNLGREITQGCELLWDTDIYEDDGSFARPGGQWMRFPVIGDYDEEILKVMVMGKMAGSFGVIDDHVSQEVRTQLNGLTDKYRNVNIVFVLEGTSRMQPFQQVTNSIDNIVNTMEREVADKKTLRFGYVVYRDYLEGDRIFEYMPLTTKSREMMAEIRDVEASDYYDRYAHESMNYGLSKAFEKVFTDPDETNILIHVAGVGSHERDDPSYVPQEVIVDLMAEYGCFYIAYQSHHTQNHQAYRDFPIQVREIMKSASQAMFEEWALVGGHELFDEKPVLVTEDNISRIKNGIPMMLIEKPYGERFDPDLLTEEITRAISQIDQYNDTVIEVLMKMLEKGSSFEVAIGEMNEKNTGTFAPGVLNALGRMDVGHEDLKHFYGENVELTVTGYAPRYHHKINSPLFRPVVLLNAREFNSIYNQVSRLQKATKGSGEVRARLHDAWLEILRRHVGAGSEIDDHISLEEASATVFGIPMRAGMFTQIMLKDIKDPSIFTDEDLRRYVQQIQRRANVLERILNERDYEYSFMSNDIKYYWIGIDKLP